MALWWGNTHQLPDALVAGRSPFTGAVGELSYALAINRPDPRLDYSRVDSSLQIGRAAGYPDSIYRARLCSALFTAIECRPGGWVTLQGDELQCLAEESKYRGYSKFDPARAARYFTAARVTISPGTTPAHGSGRSLSRCRPVPGLRTEEWSGYHQSLPAE